tara:strand:- start:219 stop:551 length:333 start_codon:yes stop_codon:yes gene_type:complete
MISKFLGKLKSILFNSKDQVDKTAVKTPLSKSKKKAVKLSKTSKPKTKKQDSKKSIDALKALPGIGSKSAEAFYKAGFKTPKSITSANDEDLLAVPGVGINLVKKLKNLK